MKRLLLTALCFLLLAGSASGATYTVCSGGCDYTDVQACLDGEDLEPGDTIRLDGDVVEDSQITWGTGDEGSEAGGYVTLDLNGHTLSSNSTYMLVLEDGVSYVHITNGIIKAGGSSLDYGVYTSDDGDHLKISSVTFDDDGQDIAHWITIYLEGLEQFNGIIVNNCFVRDTNQDDTFVCIIGDVLNVLIYNVIATGTYYFVFFDDDGDESPTAEIYNCVVYNGFDGILLFVGTDSTGVTIKNTIFDTCSVGINDDDTVNDPNIDYNCYYNNSIDASGCSKGSHAVNSNPLFVSDSPSSAEEFRLLSTSPCINTGTTIAGITTDYFGYIRDSSFDIGAAEHINIDFWPAGDLPGLAEIYSEPSSGHTVAVGDMALLNNYSSAMFFQLKDSSDTEDTPLVIDLTNASAGSGWRWHLMPITAKSFYCNTVRWDNGSYQIDGEQIADDTIDDDSIDFSDVTLNDLTFDVNSVDKTEFGYLDGVTSAIQTQIDGKLGTSGNTAWRVFYTDTNGDITELALGAANTFLGSDGTSTAPSFQALTTSDLPITGSWDMSGLDVTMANTEYDPTPSSDDSWQGSIMSVYSGEALSQWDIVYLKYSVDGPRAFAYNANSTDSDNDTYQPIGICLETTGGAGNAIDIGIGLGVARNDAWSFTDATDEGKPVYCSDDTDGAIELIAPSDSGDHKIKIGNLLDEDEILFNFGYYDEVVP